MKTPYKVSRSLGKLPEAIAEYEAAVRANPNYEDAYVNLSIVAVKAGDFAKAIKALDEAVLLGYQPPEEYVRTLEPYREKK